MGRWFSIQIVPAILFTPYASRPDTSVGSTRQKHDETSSRQTSHHAEADSSGFSAKQPAGLSILREINQHADCAESKNASARIFLIEGQLHLNFPPQNLQDMVGLEWGTQVRFQLKLNVANWTQWCNVVTITTLGSIFRIIS